MVHSVCTCYNFPEIYMLQFLEMSSRILLAMSKNSFSAIRFNSPGCVNKWFSFISMGDSKRSPFSKKKSCCSYWVPRRFVGRRLGSVFKEKINSRVADNKVGTAKVREQFRMLSQIIRLPPHHSSIIRKLNTNSALQAEKASF